MTLSYFHLPEHFMQDSSTGQGFLCWLSIPILHEKYLHGYPYLFLSTNTRVGHQLQRPWFLGFHSEARGVKAISPI